mmetsp:Transcript_28585/g.66432  ORF Transcript_28585/g.66432 Transcript_28585/m.66432 type:complete len:89 (+) Transcript_28585:136-402(+)
MISRPTHDELKSTTARQNCEVKVWMNDEHIQATRRSPKMRKNILGHSCYVETMDTLSTRPFPGRGIGERAGEFWKLDAGSDAEGNNPR